MNNRWPMMRTRVALALVATVPLWIGVVATTMPSASAASCPTDSLAVGHRLTERGVCSSLQSVDGRFVLSVSTEGIVIDQRLNQTGESGLSTETGQTWTEQPLNGDNYRGLSLELRRNGNLVLATKSGSTIWSTNTRGSGAKYLTLEPSGRLVLFAASRKRVWTSNSGVFALGGGDIVAPGERLIENTNLFSRRSGVSRNDSYKSVAVMQRDGNFVAWCTRSRRISWQTNTHRPGSYFMLQQNGAEVVKGPHGRILWSSPTAGWKHVFSQLGTRVYADGGLGRMWNAPSLNLLPGGGC